MNPWTIDECQSMAEQLGLEDDVDWFLKFKLVGGKPRYLFTGKARDKSVKVLMDDVDGEIPDNSDRLKLLVGALKKGAFKDKTPHLPFLFLRDSNIPGKFLLDYASSHVESVITARYEISRTQAIELLLNTSDPSLQGWRGKEIEKVLLTALPLSGLS